MAITFFLPESSYSLDFYTPIFERVGAAALRKLVYHSVVTSNRKAKVLKGIANSIICVFEHAQNA